LRAYVQKYSYFQREKQSWDVLPRYLSQTARAQEDARNDLSKNGWLQRIQISELEKELPFIASQPQNLGFKI
jgi:hypothetical protein